jgi:TRAP-type mannitol/chloroaromatic compound transport system permease small subunit
MRQAAFFIRLVDNINDWLGQIILFFVYVMMFVLVYEVVMRYVFGRPTVWAHELSLFFFGPHFMLAGAYAFRWRGHVNIEVFYDRFPLRTRAIVDLFVWTLFYIFMAVMLYHGGQRAWHSVMVMETSGSAWDPPIWPVMLTIPLSVALMLLQGLTKTIKDAYTAVTGRELIAEVGPKVTTSQ